MSFGSSDLQFSFNFQKSNYYYVCPWCLWVNAHATDICRGKRATLWSCFTYFGFMWSQRSNSDFQPYSQVSLPTEQCCQPWLTIFFFNGVKITIIIKWRLNFDFFFPPVYWYGIFSGYWTTLIQRHQLAIWTPGQTSYELQWESCWTVMF